MSPTTDYHPGKVDRTWFPLDASFTRDETVRRAGEPAAWLFLAILGHIRLTGTTGVITRSEIANLDVPDHAARLEALIAAGLLLVALGDHQVIVVVAWEDWQGNRARADFMRQARAEAQARLGTPGPWIDKQMRAMT